jgi:hypothetical protein
LVDIADVVTILKVKVAHSGDAGMSITVTLSSEEVAQIRQITQLDSDSEAVSRAAREFLRLTRLRQLKSVSGQVEFDENWKQLESLELEEIGFPR